MSAQTDIVSSLSNPEQFQTNKKPKREVTQGSKVLTFTICVFAIYLCLIINGIIEERIYKVPYIAIDSKQTHFYTDSISPMILTSFFATLIGFARLQQEDTQLNIPIKRLLVVVAMEISIHVLLMIALMNASYAIVVMANSASLLAVIIVGIIFSRINHPNSATVDQNNQILQSNQINGGNNNNQRQAYSPTSSNTSQKIGIQKIWICLIVIVGVYLFNLYSPALQNESDKSSHSLSLLTILILLAAITIQGFKPQLQIRIKNQYQPSPICFYYNINKVAFIATLICSLLSMNFFYTVKFIADHDQLLMHLVVMALLNSICVMFIYKIITLFRQHVYPLVGTVRKCITVGVNILYFHHSVSPMQILGVFLVFGGVFIQIVINYNLCKKYDIDLPFINEQKKQRYVKNQMNLSESRKRYQVYKVIQKEDDIVGI